VTTYAVGDLQGCYAPLQTLLDAIAFDASTDKLWLVGDLVNRGPDSVATLRFVRDLGESAVTILGNHDLHLLAVAEGFERQRKADTFGPVLEAPDRGELLDWLRRRPLMHIESGYAMVHAGLLPSWTIERARALASEVEAMLSSGRYREFLAKLYGDQPERWSDSLTGFARLRAIVNAMTRLRLCTPDGAMEFKHKGKAANLPAGYLPWFDIPDRLSRGTPLIFGHWSALGLVLREDLLGLDTGCVWGRRLSAVRLEDRRLFQVSCRKPASPRRAR
jgi:bis(5'-nucleosyl)-tetraphosphatase (symmetrical)